MQDKDAEWRGGSRKRHEMMMKMHNSFRMDEQIRMKSKLSLLWWL